MMEITGDIARYSMAMATTKAATEAQVSMLKNVMELQETSMAQLLQTMGVGGALDVQA